MGPACPYLPHVALTWPQRPGLGGVGGQGLPQLRGPPIPSSPLTPTAGQREGSPSWGWGSRGGMCRRPPGARLGSEEGASPGSRWALPGNQGGRVHNTGV